MPSELLNRLVQRRSNIDVKTQIWESCPKASIADASHLEGLSFDAPSATEWLRQQGDFPEEDPIGDALADEVKTRGTRPSHAPTALSAEDAARLQALSVSLKEVEEIKLELGATQEELYRREADLAAREAALAAELEQQRLKEETLRNYPAPSWLTNIHGTINVAVTGNAGVGKSLLINKLRRTKPASPNWAPVGVQETTLTPTMYPFGGEARVRLWDLPGAGTPKFPTETYIQTMGLRHFDKVLIVTAGRFTTTDLQLMSELEEHAVPFFMVRTKVDLDVWNNRKDNSADESTTLDLIKADMASHIQHPYLVSCRDPGLYDMPRLLREMFPNVKQQLDASAPVFVPESAWGDAWVMPTMYSPALAGIQGRWYDSWGTVYFIQGAEAHVAISGKSAVVPLTESRGCVWWINKWSVNEESVAKIRLTSEVRWQPTNSKEQPLVWWWAGC